ncbi:HAMP domain-containing sensor histidine kinase [Vibrio sp. D431a]|uniref:sensor histidine kinase n=1 Tax=Vibrio sp. D431a TaxID=2837388 RepID=UPI00255428FF|nr:ATP-binding protein [Vibrio sp. D431a]MDK9789988.1 hypothetical protein [Vibrio sp. D431a]
MFSKVGSSCFSLVVQSGLSALDLSQEEVGYLRTKELENENYNTTVLGFYVHEQCVVDSLTKKYTVLNIENVDGGYFLLLGAYNRSKSSTYHEDPKDKGHNSLVRLNNEAKDLLDRQRNCPSSVDSYEFARCLSRYVNRYGKVEETASSKRFIEEYDFMLSLVSYSLISTASLHNVRSLHSSIHRRIAALPEGYDKVQLKKDFDELYSLLEFSWELKPSEFSSYPQEGNEVSKAVHGFAERVTHKNVVISDNLTRDAQINPLRTNHNKLTYCFQILFDNAVYWAKDRVGIELIDVDDGVYNKALIVSNDGEEISESDIGKLFTKTESKRLFGGSGVGLFIAKLLSKQGGFEVFYDKNKEYGDTTSFVIRWRSR